MPQSVIEDAAQLVKANSIQGNKMNDVDVVSCKSHVEKQLFDLARY